MYRIADNEHLFGRSCEEPSERKLRTQQEPCGGGGSDGRKSKKKKVSELEQQTADLTRGITERDTLVIQIRQRALALEQQMAQSNQTSEGGMASLKAEIEQKNQKVAELNEAVLKLSEDLKLAYEASVSNTEHKLTVDRLRKEMDAQRTENQQLGKAVVERQRAQEAVEERARLSIVEAEEKHLRIAAHAKGLQDLLATSSEKHKAEKRQMSDETVPERQ